jgi:hypothetical protein
MINRNSETMAASPYRLSVRLLLSAVVIGFAIVAQPQGNIAPGILHKNDRNWIPSPRSIHVLRIDRSRKDLFLTTTLANNQVLGVSTLSEQISTIPRSVGRPVAAINGDFYRTEQESYEGDPRGLHILNGELVSGPAGVSLWIDPKNQPHIANVVPQFTVKWPNGKAMPFEVNEPRSSANAVLYTPRWASNTGMSAGRELILERDGTNTWLPLQAGQTYRARVREIRETGNSRLKSDVMVLSIGPNLAPRVPTVVLGAVLEISTGTTPDLKGVQIALGGGPQLVERGEPQAVVANKSHSLHPRSAFGWNADYFFFVTVDGRQAASRGISLPDLAAYMANQGCDEAINLDGGGSVEMWIEGRIVNRPCYGFERNTANSLVVVHRNVAAQP